MYLRRSILWFGMCVTLTLGCTSGLKDPFVDMREAPNPDYGYHFFNTPFMK